MFTRDAANKTVNITLSDADYDLLLMLVGFGTGAAFQRKDIPLANGFLALVNRMNEGNPDFRPYDIPQSPEEKK